MVDEREDRYEGEEGEYHFSDDQLNYDEVDAPKSAQGAASVKKSIGDKLSGLSPSRRMLIAGVVFISLIGIVYKMLLPASSTLPSDISQITPAKTTPMPTLATKTTEAPTAPTPPPLQQPALATPSPVMSAAAEQVPPPMTPPPPADMVQTGAPAPVPGMVQNTAAANYPVTATPPPPPPLSTTPVVTSQQPAPVPQNVADRVKAVEDHNTAMMNLLQTEYAQKMSDLEMQSNLVRGKMDEMAKRINRMESSLSQITQLLQQNAPANNKAQPMPMENLPFTSGGRPAVPKVAYTVQAIIPGRAWLKADSGDTVTVAEGDTLRDYGRISKIDPYDGVVEIDTGSKIIALSYGMSAE